MIEFLKDLAARPYVTALVGVIIGCYILRDVTRLIIYIFRRSDRVRKERE